MYTSSYYHHQAARQTNLVMNIVEHLVAQKKLIETSIVLESQDSVHFDT